MNKCIYKKETDTTQTFVKQEHIFPAGIGGIKKLPKGYVCDEVNGDIFSRMELDFMRNSPIGLCREFEGPGKRGSFSEKKATKSNVSISTSNTGKRKLSYIKMAKPYVLNQIQISVLHNQVSIIMDDSKEFTEDKYDKFISRLEEFLENGLQGKYIFYVEDKSIDDGEVFIGELDSKWYIGVNNRKIDTSKIILKMEKAIPYLKEKEMKMNAESSQISFSQKMQFNMNCFYKISAKIAFNYLASRVGQEEVLTSDFDSVRQYILRDDDNYNIWFDDKGILSKTINIPKGCHCVCISRIRKQLVGRISYYGEGFNIGVVLSDNYHGNIDMLIGICDWKNKKEYNFI